MTTDNKPVRQQLSKVTQITISPARIRRHLDCNGINKLVEDQLDALKLEILRIKKEGGPQMPAAVESLKKEATDAQKTKHAADHAKYLVELKKYNDFSSERYNRLCVVYKLCKYLNKVHNLLMKKERNVNQKKELEEYKEVLSDKPAPKKQKETDKEYSERLAKFTAPGYASYVEGVDLSNADVVQELVNKLKKDNLGVEKFLERDRISKSRIRFNDPAAVALAMAMELGIEELIEHGMKKMLESDKKTIQPDHCVGSGYKKCDWYLLFRNLPHLRAVVERQKRKVLYAEEKDRTNKAKVQKAKTIAKKTKKNYKKPVMDFPIFQEYEVSKGYAVREDVAVKNAEGVEVLKPHYKWYGIDVESPEKPVDNGNTNFYFYIQQLCKKIINRQSDSGNIDFLDIKISTNLRKFFSDLIIDFIARISPQIKLLIKAMGVKTVDEEVIKVILKSMLLDNYPDSTGAVNFSEEHGLLFKLIDEKVALCQNHQTGQVNKADLYDVKEADDDMEQIERNLKDIDENVTNEDDYNELEQTEVQDAKLSVEPKKRMAKKITNV